ncbi:hypothetical protein CPJCM30710_29300 [Clostridium polyendosporum]|uniref:VOC domain-containing protein n=1 Tax=Clostridium polyendosporum TaxID=69208 RepID=A0A919S1R8_9CLOT|nr:VOC family protein [Clostridium polyendosporum]GIM30264.1 hypothetical protein CPJCM30710_29300 [Clostridium polyendosporum]
MKFCWCTIRVRNMEESLNFYREAVGLSLNKRYTSQSGKDISFLGDGETKLELISDPNFRAFSECESISFGFEVESIEEKIKLIKEKGLEVHKGPIQPNEKIKYFYVKDPDGINIQFVENK